jgi:hypothetical protein
MKRILIFIIAPITIIAFLSYSQVRKERVRTAKAQISMLLNSYADGPYRVSGVIDIDSSIGVQKVADGKITNPYGTLNRCYLFMAMTEGVHGENQKHSIGIYRNNKIIWISEQLPGSQDYGSIPISDEGFLVVKDLNRMGKVDIVAFFSDGTNPPSKYYLWIFSWDGIKGSCINKCEKNGETSITSTGAFNVVDVDGDGIDEIQSYDSDLKINATYYWNGNLYVEKPKSSRSHR